jgi:hypothetical protein
MTPGFLAIRAHGKTHAAYNHADSYPTWLGVQAAEFIRTYDLEQAAMEADLLTHVDEDEYPTAEQLENFKARGITPQHFGEGGEQYTGRDWYGALRGCQGHLAAYLDAGYIPQLDVDAALGRADVFLEWGYIVNLDEQELRVFAIAKPGEPMILAATLPFSEIQAPGFDATARMSEIQQGLDTV